MVSCSVLRAQSTCIMPGSRGTNVCQSPSKNNELEMEDSDVSSCKDAATDLYVSHIDEDLSYIISNLKNCLSDVTTDLIQIFMYR